jgi:hypothetical protein
VTHNFVINMMEQSKHTGLKLIYRLSSEDVHTDNAGTFSNAEIPDLQRATSAKMQWSIGRLIDKNFVMVCTINMSRLFV